MYRDWDNNPNGKGNKVMMASFTPDSWRTKTENMFRICSSSFNITCSLSWFYLYWQISLCPQLDIMEPKVPDDIYKTHLENNSKSACFRICVNLNQSLLKVIFSVEILVSVLRMTGFGGSGSQVDSARMNLASSFVNGFVNAAFGQDKLLTDDGNKWLYKNKDHGKQTLI